jgi:hypothetical protein
MRGDPDAACSASRLVDVTVTIGGGGTPPPGKRNQIVGQAFCDMTVAGPATAFEPGTGRFASDGPVAGRQIHGTPNCIGKYRPRGTEPDSAWVVVCRFF